MHHLLKTFSLFVWFGLVWMNPTSLMSVVEIIAKKERKKERESEKLKEAKERIRLRSLWKQSVLRWSIESL